MINFFLFFLSFFQLNNQFIHLFVYSLVIYNFILLVHFLFFLVLQTLSTGSLRIFISCFCWQKNVIFPLYQNTMAMFFQDHETDVLICLVLSKQAA